MTYEQAEHIVLASFDGLIARDTKIYPLGRIGYYFDCGSKDHTVVFVGGAVTALIEGMMRASVPVEPVDNSGVDPSL